MLPQLDILLLGKLLTSMNKAVWFWFMNTMKDWFKELQFTIIISFWKATISSATLERRMHLWLRVKYFGMRKEFTEDTPRACYDSTNITILYYTILSIVIVIIVVEINQQCRCSFHKKSI